MLKSKVYSVAILALFAGLLLVVNVATAQVQEESESPALTGFVVDAETQQPIPGVELKIEGTETTAQTDEQGTFSFSGLQPGTYTITASPEGYEEVAKEVEFSESGVVLGAGEEELIIQLTPSTSEYR